MATKKTVLTIEVTNKEWNIRYTGGFKPDWENLKGTERKTVLRHDARIMDALIACPEAFERIAGFVHSIEHFKKREAKKAAKQARETHA